MTTEDAIKKIKNFADHCYPNEEFIMAIKALEQQICDNDCEHCDWVTCPKMEEEENELKPS